MTLTTPSETEPDSARPIPPTLADRYAGVLLGLACGDALGGAVEFCSRAQIAAAHPDGLRDFVGGGWLHLVPGENTDDTQSTIALAESFAASPELAMDDFARRLLVWMRTDPKDIGTLTRVALNNLAEGQPWQEAGERALRSRGEGSAAGNGSVMRCAPVALRHRHDTAALRRASIDSSRITHADRRCTWASVAVNQAIVALLGGGSAADALSAAMIGIEDPATLAVLGTVPTLHRDSLRAGGYVLHTLAAAFWCLLNHDSLEETIVAAVALGEDTDTTAAVAGA
ncbi:MAG: ADP-ribosylglycohydrolase family protein, partial [Thermomicrobiales bacterium]